VFNISFVYIKTSGYKFLDGWMFLFL